jgi:HEAT repeats
VRFEAVYRIGKLGEKAKIHIPVLIKRFKNEPEADVRGLILEALCNIDPTSDLTYRVVLDGLRDPSLTVSCVASVSIRTEFGDRPMKDLVQIANNPKEKSQVRIRSLVNIGIILRSNNIKMVPDSVLDCLKRNLFDKDDDVRCDAAICYYEIAQLDAGLIPAETIVKSFTTDKFDLVRLNLRRVLPYCGKKIMPDLRKALRHPEEDVRCITLYVLRDLGDDARPALEDIRAMINDPSEEIREAATEVLEKLTKKK